MLEKIEKNKLATSVCLSTLLALVTGYVFCHAVDSWYGDVFLMLLVFLTVLCLFLNDTESIELNKKIVYCWLGYLGLALASALYPLSDLARSSGLLRVFGRFACVTIIVLLFWTQRRSLEGLVRWLLPILCLTLSVLMLLSAYRLFDKDIFELISPWEVHASAWQNKVFCFYLVFLMWGAVAALWRKSVAETLIASGIVAISLWALLSYGSESSQLAFVGGVFIFVFMHLPIKKYRYAILLVICSMFLLIPLLWTVFAPLLEDPLAIYNDSNSLLKRYFDVGIRVFLYDFCAEMARGEFLFGYGFGSVPKISMPEGVVPPFYGALPGGHPHNIVFLFLLEHGFLGFLWLAGMFFVLFDYLYHATVNRFEGPAVFALLVSGQIIFSLSFAIWIPDVILIYGMFFVFLLIASSVSGYNKTTVWRERVFTAVQFLVLFSFISHVAAGYFSSVS